VFFAGGRDENAISSGQQLSGDEAKINLSPEMFG